MIADESGRALDSAQDEAPPRRATVRDVAREAGVALSSASRVLMGHPDVSPRMRERVVTAARHLGYEPDLIAQSLRTGRTHTLGFLVADLANPIFADVIRGACDQARERGYSVLLTNSEGDPTFDAEHLQLFLRRRVDGVILLTVSSDSPDIDREIAVPSVPMVVFDRDVPAGSRVSAVYWDHASGFRDAASTLIGHGHREIAFIGGSDRLRPVRERLAGFAEALRSAGIIHDPALIRLGPLQAPFAREATGDLLAGTPRPSALVVGANRLLPGVLEALHAAQVVPGRDLAIVSSDDVELTRLYQPAISVVVRDTYGMGQLAVRTVLERIESPSAPIRSVTLPTRFVERASSAWDV